MLLSKMKRINKFLKCKLNTLANRRNNDELCFQFGKLVIRLKKSGDIIIKNTNASFMITSDGHIVVSAAHTIQLEAKDRIDLN